MVKVTGDTVSLSDFPTWSFDGSSTYQAQGNDSDLMLHPVTFVTDPIRGEGNFLVLCEVFDDQGNPLWANGGYMLKEDDWNSSVDISLSAVNPVYYLDGGKSGEVFPNPWTPWFRNLLQLYNTLRGENQVWALHRAMGSECLSPNARGLQMVDGQVAEKGRRAVQFYFENKQVAK